MVFELKRSEGSAKSTEDASCSVLSVVCLLSEEHELPHSLSLVSPGLSTGGGRLSSMLSSEVGAGATAWILFFQFFPANSTNVLIGSESK